MSGPEVVHASDSKSGPASNLTSAHPSKPIRLAHILWHGRLGGAQKAVYQLVKEQLRDPRLAPAVLFAHAEGEYWSEMQATGCYVAELAVSRAASLYRVPSLVARLNGFEIHHFHSAEPLLMLASSACPRATRVYTHRGGLTRYSPRKRVRYALTGALVRNAFHGVSGNTHAAARAAAALLHVDPDDISVTYNGLDFDLLEPMRSPDEVRRELAIPPDAFVVGTAAELRALKRIDLLINAVSDVRDPNLRLLILGDGEDRSRLERLVRQLALDARVIFAGTKRHIADYLQVMDVFSLPSNAHESFGNALVEAMAMGLPPIVFADGGGLLEHIHAGTTGFVVANQGALNATIRLLRADHDLARQVGQNASKQVRSRYTLEVCAARYRALYARALRADRDA